MENDWRKDIKGFVFSAGPLWNVAAEAAQRATDAERADPGTVTTDTLVSLILAAASTEAFINELPRHVLDFGPDVRPYLAETPEGRELLGIHDALETMEEENAQILSKYIVASMVLPGIPLNKGTQPYQDFARLIGLRNAIMHMKIQEHPAEGKIEKLLSYFQSRKWTYDPGPNVVVIGWLSQIQTPQIARWACRSAAAVALDIADRFDSGNPVRFMWDRMRTDPRVLE